MNDLKSPWKLKNPEPCFFTVEDDDGNDFIHFNNHEFGEGNFDDIRHQALCAVAAPEMYASLEKLVNTVSAIIGEEALSEYINVLKKARGES